MVDADEQLRRGRHFSSLVLRDANQVVNAVTSAVERQMVSDVPFGSLFPAASIPAAATMRQVARLALFAFTVGTNGGELDESDAAGGQRCRVALRS